MNVSKEWVSRKLLAESVHEERSEHYSCLPISIKEMANLSKHSVNVRTPALTRCTKRWTHAPD